MKTITESTHTFTEKHTTKLFYSVFRYLHNANPIRVSCFTTKKKCVGLSYRISQTLCGGDAFSKFIVFKYSTISQSYTHKLISNWSNGFADSSFFIRGWCDKCMQCVYLPTTLNVYESDIFGSVFIWHSYVPESDICGYLICSVHIDGFSRRSTCVWKEE